MTDRRDNITSSASAETGAARRYVRFAALGDSLTYGLGDGASGQYRGWARILADAIGKAHDLSFCNTAIPGATAADVRAQQLQDALAHQPTMASLVVGLNDTMRSTWDPARIREDLLHCAERLTGQGAILLTVRFHDHTRLFPLPRFLARSMRSRINALNEIYEEIYERFGGIRVDVTAHPAVYDRGFWSVDRLHPSELGHRALADSFAESLRDAGLEFQPPGLKLDGHIPGRLEDLRWLVNKGAPGSLGARAISLRPQRGRCCVRRRQASSAFTTLLSTSTSLQQRKRDVTLDFVTAARSVQMLRFAG